MKFTFECAECDTPCYKIMIMSDPCTIPEDMVMRTKQYRSCLRYKEYEANFQRVDKDV